MSRKTVLSLVVVVALFELGSPTQAGDVFSQTTFGINFFSASPPCPLRDFPTFETIAPVPAIFDADANNDIASFSCFIDVSKKGNPVNKAKGTYETEVIVRDNNTGILQAFPIASGKFATNSNGVAQFEFEIPAPIFEDGFESGDISAWSYTRTDFTKKKKADNASVQCKGASNGNN